MSFWKRLFGLETRGNDDDLGIEGHLSYFDSLALPAISMSGPGMGKFSQIGGLPSLPEGVAWPDWKGVPMAFLCQIDLSEVPSSCERGGLPTSGILFFFYNQEQETWGFDPKDKGSWEVIYTASRAEDCTEIPMPLGLEKGCLYERRHIDLGPIRTWPDAQDERVDDMKLTDGQVDEYVERCEAVFEGEPAHHLLGYPAPVQGNDMDLECELVSHGLYCGDASGYRDPRAKKLEAGRSDWILLLQLDTDDESEMMWGDCGMLYFWIRKSDLQEVRFENCWIILQCG